MTSLELSSALKQAFASAIILDLRGNAWKPSVLPSFVISACCPFSDPLSEAIDRACHEALRRRIQRIAGASMEEVVGQSVDGSWKEPSWAVSGISEEEAIALGRLFYQWAIFRFDDNGRSLILLLELKLVALRLANAQS